MRAPPRIAPPAVPRLRTDPLRTMVVPAPAGLSSASSATTLTLQIAAVTLTAIRSGTTTQGTGKKNIGTTSTPPITLERATTNRGDDPPRRLPAVMLPAVYAAPARA